jgi:hypothetical protein
LTGSPAILLVALSMPVAPGCGGGKSGGNQPAGGGVSIQEQYKRALADKNPPSRVSSLVHVGEQQLRAGDS